MEYVLQRELLKYRRVGIFLVEKKLGRVVVNGQSRMKVHRTWNTRMKQRRKPAVHCVRVQLNMPFYGDRGERIFVMMLDNLI